MNVIEKLKTVNEKLKNEIKVLNIELENYKHSRLLYDAGLRLGDTVDTE